VAWAAGLAAEELIYGSDGVTSGPSNDLEQATSTAVHMVERWVRPPPALRRARTARAGGGVWHWGGGAYGRGVSRG
jgi:ATP-dependent Zn protease